MIDFKNASFVKLTPAEDSTYSGLVTPILAPGEEIVRTFQAMRDGIVFTNKRIISINVQGLTGKKKDLTSLPYARIQAFSVETSGVMDLDGELEIWFSGLGAVKLEFGYKVDIAFICQLISQYCL